MAKMSFFFLGFVLSAVCILFTSSCCYAETTHDQLHELTHTIQLTSLLPSTVCDSSSKADEKKSALKSRVNSIHSRLSSSRGGDIKETDAANIPAKDGSMVGSGNYIVTVGFGTPKKDLSLIFDTGSDLTWTQCQPCLGPCYEQKETVFDPKASNSYTNISCSSALCNSLVSATGNTPRCSSSTCVYGVQYGDNSFSAGYFGKETLTLTPTDQKTLEVVYDVAGGRVGFAPGGCS
ncbi:hypothetical protein QYF36_009931 [Acer negundo]|nr:hypothetical protein QYF36_009931 [Acer negundo]